MPNRSSNAGHTPIRTCVVCRERRAQSSLLGFYFQRGGLVFDLNGRCQHRKMYLCPFPACVNALPKWMTRYKKKHNIGPKQGADL